MKSGEKEFLLNGLIREENISKEVANIIFHNDTDYTDFILKEGDKIE